MNPGLVSTPPTDRAPARRWLLGALGVAVAIAALTPLAVAKGPAAAAAALSATSAKTAVSKPAVFKAEKSVVPATDKKVAWAAARAIVAKRAHSGDYRARQSVAEQGGSAYLIYNIEFDGPGSCASFSQSGVSVFSRVDRFADVFVTVDQNWQNTLTGLFTNPNIVKIEGAGGIVAPPPGPGAMGAPSRALPERIVRGGYGGLTGKGVLIAIVDSGLDFRNPDFITYDASGQPTSRLLYLWDTSSDAYDRKKLGNKAPISYPNGASIGTLYTRDQLTAELRASTKSIPSTDLNGHGTSCAGVAAGNGNNGKGRNEVIGVAPDADLIGVRIGSTANRSLDKSFLLGAICGWLDQAAGSTPLVVSCSFGGHRGGHDGSRVAERQLDARFPLDKPGRAICIAAGNEGYDKFHAEANLRGADAPAVLVWAATETTTVSVYFDTGNMDDLKYQAASFKDGGGTTILKVTPEIDPVTKQAIAYFDVPPGRGGLLLFTGSGNSVVGDAYVPDGDASFAGDLCTFNKMVGEPGTASHAITVGSYDWSDAFDAKGKSGTVPVFCSGERAEMVVGQASCYSSPGPSRSKVIKPDITAPGQYYRASYAHEMDGKGVNPEESFLETSEKYQLFNGTSAATPYTAGIVALMFQKKGALTLGEIKSLMTQSATRDDYTGDLPNPKWGNGKLDLVAVQKMLDAIH